MEKCPYCKEYSIAFDGYRNVKRCVITGCTCIIVDDISYSILKHNTKTVDRVLIVNGKESHIEKSYKRF